MKFSLYKTTKLSAIVSAGLILLACGGGGTSPEPSLVNAGIFVHPEKYTPAAYSEATTKDFRQALSSATGTSTWGDIPTYDETLKIVSLPNVSVNGTMFGKTNLQLNGDGSFSVVQMPILAPAVSISAASYANGYLTLKSIAIGGHRFSNVSLHLDADGKFRLASFKDPLVVSKSSYENKMAAASINGAISLRAEFLNNIQNSKLYSAVLNGHSWAFADFFQDGAYSMIAHTIEYNWNAGTADKIGNIYFFKKEGTQWVDRTSDILSDNVGCIHSRKTVVSDFNNDGVPDIFFACTGLDANPFPGEKSLILLSQPDGKYLKSFIGWMDKKLYTHGASAADIDGDGYADIAISGAGLLSGSGPSGVLINQGNGNFAFSSNRINATIQNKNAYSAELIKFNGRSVYDLFLGGNESTPSYSNQPQILENDGAGYFSSFRTFPQALPNYGFVLDVIYDNGWLYALRTNDVAGTPKFYSNAAIQKIKYPEMTTASLIYEHAGNYVNNYPWINWIGFKDNNIISLDADYGVRIPK